jgi:hypothetical protein
MPTKTILSPAQRAAIFDPPLDRATIERLYTLGLDDLAQVARRRRGANRIGYAVQLCYLRHPGRGLLTGENVPDTMLALGSEIAASTDRGEAIATGMVDRLRTDRIVLPAASTLERLALIVRTWARKAAHANLVRNCSTEQEAALEHLIASDDHGRTRLGWIREWPEAPSAANLKGIVERLGTMRDIGIAADRARRIHAARYAVIARTAGIATAQHLRRLERPRRLAMLIASMIEMEAAWTDAALAMVEKMVGPLFRRADRTRADRLLGQAQMLKDTARFHAQLGRPLVDAHASGRDAFRDRRSGGLGSTRTQHPFRRGYHPLDRRWTGGGGRALSRRAAVRPDLPCRLHLPHGTVGRPAAWCDRCAAGDVLRTDQLHQAALAQGSAAGGRDS